MLPKLWIIPKLRRVPKLVIVPELPIVEFIVAVKPIGITTLSIWLGTEPPQVAGSFQLPLLTTWKVAALASWIKNTENRKNKTVKIEIHVKLFKYSMWLCLLYNFNDTLMNEI